MGAPTSAAAEHGAPRRVLLLWTAVAVAARLGALLWAGPSLPCNYDECSYVRLGEALLAGAGFVTEKGFLWPPGYPLFLAPLLAVGGTATARLVQALLGGLLVPVVAVVAARAAAGLGSEAARRRAVHVACALTALDPTLVAYAHLLWPETIFSIPFTAALALLLGTMVSPGRAVAAGALFGVATLLKAVTPWLAIPTLAALASTLPPRARLRICGLALAALALTIAPWTLRNAWVHGRWMLVDATGGTNLRLGNSDAPPVTWDWGAFDRKRARADNAACATGDFIDKDRCQTRQALTWMAAHPLEVLRRVPTKWADLVSPTSFLVRHVRTGRYGDRAFDAVSPGAAALATAASALPWMATAILAALGLAAVRAGAPRRVTLALLTALLIVHGLTFGMSRFRMPVVPLLHAWAGVGVAALLGAHPIGSTGRQRLLLVAVLVVIAALWGARSGELLDFAPLTLPAPELR